MKAEQWVEKIKDKDDRKFAREAVAEMKEDVLRGIVRLEDTIDDVQMNDLVKIGVQRGYRNVRNLIQS